LPEGLIVPNKGTIIPKMGMKKTSLGEALFTKTQRRVLGLLFGNPDRSYYANEIVRFAGAGIGAVQRELERLESARLVTVSKIGNQKHYQANRQAPIYSELHGIVLKTFGVADHLKSMLAPLASRIKASFVYGSIADGTDTANSDIDVMVIGTASFEDVVVALQRSQEQLGREVNPNVYRPDEFTKKLKAKDPFLLRVTEQPKLFVLGNEDDLRQLGKNRKSKTA